MTIKQKLAMKLSLENGGNITKAMREAGYNENTIHNPSNLTQSKTWLRLMEDKLPDTKLLDKHIEALEATRTVSAQVLVQSNGKVVKKEDEGIIETPDYLTRLKAVELGYRIKGKLRPEEGTNQTNILVIPGELIKKYDTSPAPDPSHSSL
jgi:hypothetical protein